MIIKITVHDNDFTPMLYNFAQDIIKKYPIKQHSRKALEEKGVVDFKEQVLYEMQYHQNEKRWNRLMQGNYKDYSDQDKSFVCQVLKAAWSDYVQFNPAKEYLNQHFDCQICAAVTDTWYNGEMIYIFPGAYFQRAIVDF